MQSLVSAVLVASLACSAPLPPAQTSAARVEGPKMLVAVDTDVTLTEKPTTLRLPLGDAAAQVQAVAHDDTRALVLRIERISIDRQPGVTYRVDVGDQNVGMLTFYGAEESNGTFMAAFTVDEAAARALERDASALPVTLTPQGSYGPDGRPNPVQLEGHARFRRVSLVAE